MAAMRMQEHIPKPYQALQFFADLSQYTLPKRKNLHAVTKLLRNHKIVYCWGYPTKLSIMRENHTYTVTSLEKGLNFL